MPQHFQQSKRGNVDRFGIIDQVSVLLDTSQQRQKDGLAPATNLSWRPRVATHPLRCLKHSIQPVHRDCSERKVGKVWMIGRVSGDGRSRESSDLLATSTARTSFFPPQIAQ